MAITFSNFNIIKADTTSGAISAPLYHESYVETNYPISALTFTYLSFKVSPAEFLNATQNSPNNEPTNNYFEFYNTTALYNTIYTMSWVGSDGNRPGLLRVMFENIAGFLRINLLYYFIPKYDINSFVQNITYNNQQKLLKDSKINPVILDNSNNDVYSNASKYLKLALYIRETNTNDLSKFDFMCNVAFRFYNRDTSDANPVYLSDVGFELIDGVNQITALNTNLTTLRVRHKVEELAGLIPCFGWESVTDVYFILINTTNNNTAVYFLDNYQAQYIEAQTGTQPLSSLYLFDPNSVWQAPFTPLNNYTGIFWDVNAYINPSLLTNGNTYRIIAVYQINSNCPFTPPSTLGTPKHFFSFISPEYTADQLSDETTECVSLIESSICNYNYCFGDWIKTAPLLRLKSKIKLDISNYTDLPSFITSINVNFIDQSNNAIIKSDSFNNFTNTINTLSFEYTFRTEYNWENKSILIQYLINHDNSIITINQKIEVDSFDPNPGGQTDNTTTDFSDVPFDYLCEDNQNIRFCLSQNYTPSGIADDRINSFLLINNSITEDEKYPSTIILQETSADFISNPDNFTGGSHCMDVVSTGNISDNVSVATSKIGGGFGLLFNATSKNHARVNHDDTLFTGYNFTTHSTWIYLPNNAGGTEDVVIFEKAATNFPQTTSNCLDCNSIAPFTFLGTRPKIYMKVNITTLVVEVGWEHGSTRRCIIQSTNTLTTGVWHNIIWVRKGERAIDQELYIDGILETNVVIADELLHDNQITFDECTDDTGSPIDQFGAPTGGGYFTGYYKNYNSVNINTLWNCEGYYTQHLQNLTQDWILKRISWWKRDLSLTEITSLYSNGMNASLPRTDLILDVKTNHEEGDVICDHSPNNLIGRLNKTANYLECPNTFDCTTLFNSSGFDDVNLAKNGGTWLEI